MYRVLYAAIEYVQAAIEISGPPPPAAQRERCYVTVRHHCIAGAGLDVFEVEPLSAYDPLIGLENVILTPHWSASTRDVWLATGQAMAEGMLKAARGERPDHVVNTEVLDRPAFREKLARFEENRSIE